MADDKKKSSKHGITAMYIIFAVIVVFIILMFIVNNVVYMRIEVEGTSMMPTLADGDILVTSKVASPRRDDIVIIDKAVDGVTTETWIIKRVIAVGGDKIKFDIDKTDSISYIYRDTGDGFEKVSAATNTVTNRPVKYVLGQEYLIEKGELFYLGDNRGNSLDSRANGCCKTSDVKGVVPSWSVSIKGFTTFVTKKIVQPLKGLLKGCNSGSDSGLHSLKLSANCGKVKNYYVRT